jgi:enamine deaminase RidA (YjgF/YER057c/UK114 family)
MSRTPWRQINPESLPDPIGYSNAIVTSGGRRVVIAGQTALGKDQKIQHIGDLVAQSRVAFEGIATILKEAGAQPEHLVRMRIFVMSAESYAQNSREIGMLYRQHFGKWFPAMTLVQVARLFDEGALIEIEAEAVIPDDQTL